MTSAIQRLPIGGKGGLKAVPHVNGIICEHLAGMPPILRTLSMRRSSRSMGAKTRPVSVRTLFSASRWLSRAPLLRLQVYPSIDIWAAVRPSSYQC